MHRRAFTLMEMMIVLAVIGLVFAASIVGFSGLNEETALNKPWDDLRPLAKKAWKKALSKQLAYQIRIYPNRFVLQPRQAGGEGGQPLPPTGDAPGGGVSDMEEVAIDPEAGITVEVRRWRQRDWIRLEKNMYVDWIFEQSGLLEPIAVRFTTAHGTVGGRFDPLTASALEDSDIQ